MTNDNDICPQDSKPLVLVAINDEKLWQDLEEPLTKLFRVRRETDGLRAIDVLLLLRPVAVIAETGLPGLSGILLARLIRHNRYLTKLPVALILSRDYLIEEFWAKDSGAVVTVPRKNAADAIFNIEIALAHRKPIQDVDWDAAEEGISAEGGPAAGVASELEKQLIGANIIAKLGEIEISQEPGGSGSPGTIPAFIREALAALAAVLEFAQAGITLLETNELFIVENKVFADILDSEAFVRETLSSSALYIDRSQESGGPRVTYLTPVHIELPGPRGPASTFFALPLSGREKIYGLLSLMTYKEIAVREYYLNTLSLIGTQLAVTLERALFYEEVRRLSVTDSLTGLSNRRAIQSRLEEEFRRSVRYRTPLSVAVCDLDGFKILNDKHGHQAGDEMLKAIAQVLRISVREVDLAGRWGGEEMALLFPQTALPGAIVACERIREQIASMRIDFHGSKLGVTLSIGVATIDPEEVCPRSADALIALADSAMYLAKKRGKNRVANFLELPEPSPAR